MQHLAAAGEAHFGAALALARDHGLLRLLLRLVEGEGAGGVLCLRGQGGGNCACLCRFPGLVL